MSSVTIVVPSGAGRPRYMPIRSGSGVRVGRGVRVQVGVGEGPGVQVAVGEAVRVLVFVGARVLVGLAVACATTAATDGHGVVGLVRLPLLLAIAPQKAQVPTIATTTNVSGHGQCEWLRSPGTSGASSSGNGALRKPTPQEAQKASPERTVAPHLQQ